MYIWLVVGLATVVSATFDYTADPNLYYDTWWGPDDADKDDTSITPFTIEWPDEVIEDLVTRLKNRRPLTPPLDDSGYNYGTNTDTISYWLDYWQNEYNFTERLAFMNKYPQFKTPIRGLGIHFIRVQPEVPDGKYSIPVLMLHGFPVSVRDFYDSIDDITAADDDRDFVVDLIMPSLPGFCYSDYTNRQGLGAAEMAFIFKDLMSRLGHEKFYCQGGDWGSTICGDMATFFANDILGYHSNMGLALTDAAFAMISTASINPESLVPTDLVSRLYPLKSLLQNVVRETGYFHIQASKPDTLGICVGESPTSLVSWFLHIFSSTAGIAKRNDTMGGVDMFGRDQFLDNVMNYWVTGRITTAFRIYAETFNLRNYRIGYKSVPTTVPTVVVQAQRESFYMPPAALKTKFTNLVDVEVLYEYGHYLAWEASKDFAVLVLRGLQKIITFRQDNDM